MELDDGLLHEMKEPEKIRKKERINLEKDSIQYNAQDLEQEQKVDVNPVQLNTQNLHVHVSNDCSGKITGSTYLEKSKEIIPTVYIHLYFGHDRILPVYTTNSDLNGNFIIEDIPPGYYTLVAQYGSLKYESHYIKVFAGHSVHQSILLK